MWPASPPKERADAARNRLAVLDAAERLFRAHGVGNVSMDAIATEAGVGKGTLFRRFGDKAGLAAALLDERERDLQQRILTGPPPLGPGAPAAQRLSAFFESYVEYALAHLELTRMSETARPAARYSIGAYRFWHRHASMLLSELETDADTAATAHMLLAMTAGEHLAGVSPELGSDRIQAALQWILRKVSA